MIGLQHYLVSSILFVLGVLGIFLNRKNIIIILMAIELILLSVNINLVAFSAYLGDLDGQVFAMFVLTVWALRVDALTAVMLVVVTTVSAPRPPLFVGLYGRGPDQPRFFAYLSLFTFAMLMLVTATTCSRCSSAGKAWASPPTC
jgi:NADH-quinone oxidoreductase subunit K